jgi:preprotein translocase subunit YajC
VQPTASTVPKEQPITVNLLLVYVVILGGAMIFMMSRSRKKQSAQQAMTRNALVVGAEVRTIGGVIGEVIEVTDEHVIVETTPGVRLKFIKSAIAGVVAPADPEEAGEFEFESAESDGEEPVDAAPSAQAVEQAPGDAGLDGAAEESAAEERAEVSAKS